MSKTDEQKSLHARKKEIARILLRNHATRGMTPQRLRAILEDLGPTFVKLGQLFSMRSDILPESYCQELEKLRADVAPMPFDEVRLAVYEATGKQLEDSFSSFEQTPVGAASIAQAHRAVLKDGQRVVVKIQRRNIRAIMAQDFALLHKTAGMVHLAGLDKTIDFSMVLNEMQSVTEQEMDFTMEAQSLREFAQKNEALKYVACPKVMDEMCCETLLCMEYIDGLSLYDDKRLVSAGYDLKEIGDKLAESYIYQVLETGFFHADPHPGNLRIRDGQIIYLDMGMMGRLTERDRELISKAAQAVAVHDVEAVRRVVMSLGRITGTVNPLTLTADIDDFLIRYESAELGSLDLGLMLKELMNIAKKNHIAMPSGMTMLARGIMTIEGVLRKISPDTNILQILSHRLSQSILEDVDIKKEGGRFLQDLHDSFKKTARLPGQLSDLMRTAGKGQAQLNVSLSPKEGVGVTEKTVFRLMRALLSGFCILSAAVALSSGGPMWGAFPAAAYLLFSAGIVLGISALWKKTKR